MEAHVATTSDVPTKCCDDEKFNEPKKYDCVATYKRQITDLENRVAVLKGLVASLQGHTEVADRINDLHNLDYGSYF